MSELYRDACPGACAVVNVCRVGFMGNNVYIIENIADPEDCFLVDASGHAAFVLEALAGRTPSAIVLTHYHFDHVGAAAELREATGAPVYAHETDAVHVEYGSAGKAGIRKVAPCAVGVKLRGGEALALAGLTWTVLHTPGHSPGSICLFAEGEEGTRPLLVAGDTLFAGNIGRTDFADGSWEDMRTSLERLSTLPDETVVLTGHDALTTIGALRRPVFDRYLHVSE